MKQLIYILFLTMVFNTLVLAAIPENRWTFKASWLDEDPLVPGGISSEIGPNELGKFLEENGVTLGTIESLLEGPCLYGGQETVPTKGVIFEGTSEEESLKMWHKVAGDLWKKIADGDLYLGTLPTGANFYFVGYRYDNIDSLTGRTERSNKVGRLNGLTWLRAGSNFWILTTEVQIDRPDGYYQLVEVGFLPACGNIVVTEISPPQEREGPPDKPTEITLRPEVKEISKARPPRLQIPVPIPSVR